METTITSSADLRAKYHKFLGLITNIEYKDSNGQTRCFRPTINETLEMIDVFSKYITDDNPEITPDEFVKIKKELTEEISIFSDKNNKNMYLNLISKIFKSKNSDGGDTITVKELPLIYELIESWNIR